MFVKYLQNHAVYYTPTHMVKCVVVVRKYLWNICAVLVLWWIVFVILMHGI